MSDGTLARTAISAGSVTTSSASGTSSGGGVTVQTPTAPTGFQVTGGFANISLRWNWPTSSNQYSGHSFTEVWRHTSDVLSSATLTGSSAGSTFTDYVGGGQTYYYWIRHVNTNNVAGPYNASAGTLGQTQPDTTYLTSLLASSITSSELAGSLATPIALIPSLENFVGYSTSYSGNSLLTRMGAVETTANDAATSAQLTSESSTRAIADAANASDITALQATVFEADGTTPKISAAAVTALTTEVFPNGTASASSIDTLSTGYSDPDGSGSSVTLQQAMSTQLTLNGTLKGQYTVKIDAAGTIAGFGLANTTTTSTPFSEFYVRADNFALLPPSTTVTSFPTTGNYQNRTVYRSDLNETYYYNTASSSWVTSPPSLPFVVTTSPQTIQGETVPQGVYIDTAYMNKGRVLDLVAGSVVADYMSATVAMDAPYLFGGTINVGQINKPTSDPRDWTVSGTTRVSNFSVDANGVMHANSGKLTPLTIYPTATDLTNNTNIIFDSNGFNGTYIKNASVDTLRIAGNAVTVPDGISGNISVTLGTSYVKVGELTVDYDDPAHTPSGVIGIAGVQVSGNTSGSDQTLNVELRRVYTNNAYNGQHVAESVKYDFGHVVTIGAHWTVAQVSTATTFKLELWAKVHTGSRSANRYFISAITSKR